MEQALRCRRKRRLAGICAGNKFSYRHISVHLDQRGEERFDVPASVAVGMVEMLPSPSCMLLSNLEVAPIPNSPLSCQADSNFIPFCQPTATQIASLAIPGRSALPVHNLSSIDDAIPDRRSPVTRSLTSHDSSIAPH